MNEWALVGVGVVVLGFALRLNALLVVVAAGLATGIAAGMDLQRILELTGGAFLKNRFLMVFVLTLPVIGLLERNGLREQAERWVLGLTRLSTGRLLLAYQALRQVAAMLGLTHLGGHPQTVRPLLVPMAEATATRGVGPLPERVRERLRAMCAGTDNVGLFFGEDVFVAFGAVLLMQSFLAQHGHAVEPLAIALWGLPTAIAAFLVHGARVARIDHRMAAEIERIRTQAARA
ncbi:MAG: DUF969 domain-containing protein [Xanthomonadaceae bacterium]|jgi:uncharacterized membrane protein|nr:DUF969 domain-containing protein [Xanthomonadaceae bacterium]